MTFAGSGPFRHRYSPIDWYVTSKTARYREATDTSEQPAESDTEEMATYHGGGPLSRARRKQEGTSCRHSDGLRRSPRQSRQWRQSWWWFWDCRTCGAT